MDTSVSQAFPCPYLPDRIARSQVFSAEGVTGEGYESLLALGFRRCGRIIYRPACPTCRECKQLRVPVASFQPTRAMRRVWRRNPDVRVVTSAPEPSTEKHRLYVKYLDAQHDGTMSKGYESFLAFLYDSPLETMEFQYQVGTQIAAISIADVCPGGLSSVYVFFDPEMSARSLGVYSALWEIDYCKQSGLSYYYLGFYVADCHAMNYKARFRPNEIALQSGQWVELRGA